MTLIASLIGVFGDVSWIGLSAILSCVYILCTAIYRWKFHQLSIYPGPLLWSVSRIPYTYYFLRGTMTYRLAQLHDQYGTVVRVAPDELSYINEEAWSDIYGAAGKGKSQLIKDQRRRPKNLSGSYSILTTPYDNDHARMRRNFAKAFTDKSLREQEPILNKYFNLLISRLHEKSVDGPVDLDKFYNFTTFDIIGDLTYAESFGCLETDSLHRWVSLVFEVSKSVSVIGAFIKLSPLTNVLLSLVPKSREMEVYFRGFANERLAKRLAMTEPRSDFMTVAQKTVDTPEGMTTSELRESSNLIIVAGSETTATFLTGVTHQLLMNPSKHRKLIEEIRSSFKSESEITNASTVDLPYLHAVIQEGLRYFPAVPSTFARETPPEGCVINGKFVAGNTVVGIHHWSAYHSPTNFYLPDQFIPERWMGQDERFANDKRGVFQPFHVGPRNCIGKSLAWMEMRVILAKIIFNFDMSLEEESRREWEQELKVFSFWEKPPLLVKLMPVVRD